MRVLTDTLDHVVWRVTDGPDTWIDTRITFSLRPSGHGGTTLLFTQWFAPDGFESRVSELELRPGGQLRYTMTATAPEQVALMRNTGNPLSAEVRKTFTEVGPPTRLAYLSLIDFVPDHEPYEHLTTIYIEPGRAAADPHRQGGRGRRPVRARARCPGHPTRPRS